MKQVVRDVNQSCPELFQSVFVALSPQDRQNLEGALLC